jgi:hypothetical protein
MFVIADLWRVLGVYLIGGVITCMLGWRLWKADAPPGGAYIVFAIFGGVVLLYVLIDTQRLAEIPGVRLGNALYRLEAVEDQVKDLRRNLVGYETESFPPGSYEVVPAPGDARRPFRVVFKLKHAAVRDSVWVFENDVPISPTRFDVEGNRVTVHSPVKAQQEGSEYVVRYFQAPATWGGAEWGGAKWGGAEFGAGESGGRHSQ